MDAHDLDAQDHDPIDAQVTDLLDALIPRRDARYAPAHAFAVACLTTDLSTQRLVRRALRNISPDPDQPPTTTPGVDARPESGGDVPAPAADPSPPLGPRAVLSCGGKACETRADGKEIHRPDPSCSKFGTGKRARAGT